MPWREEAEENLPPLKPTEPAQLRLDILDELEDHLACAVVREREVCDNGDSAVWGRVLERFGDPAALARRLWWDAMREAIMREWIKTGAIVAMAIVIVVFMGFTLRYIQNNNQTMLQALQDIKTSTEMSMATLNVTVRRGAEDGPLAADLEVDLSGKLFDEDTKHIIRTTDTSGTVTIGPLRQGEYILTITDPLTTMTSWQRFTCLGGPEEIVVLAPPVIDPVPIDFTLDAPDYADDKHSMVLADLFYTWEGNTWSWESEQKVLIGTSGVWKTEEKYRQAPQRSQHPHDGKTYVIKDHRDIFQRNSSLGPIYSKTEPLLELPVTHWEIDINRIAIQYHDPEAVMDLYAQLHKPVRKRTRQDPSGRERYAMAYTGNPGETASLQLAIPEFMQQYYLDEALLYDRFKKSDLPAPLFYKVRNDKSSRPKLICMLEEDNLPDGLSYMDLFPGYSKQTEFPVSFHYFPMCTSEITENALDNTTWFLGSKQFITEKTLVNEKYHVAFIGNTGSEINVQATYQSKRDGKTYNYVYDLYADVSYFDLNGVLENSNINNLSGIALVWEHSAACPCEFCAKLDVPHDEFETPQIIENPVAFPSELFVISAQNDPAQY